MQEAVAIAVKAFGALPDYQLRGRSTGERSAARVHQLETFSQVIISI
jgi:hypothetical protein